MLNDEFGYSSFSFDHVLITLKRDKYVIFIFNIIYNLFLCIMKFVRKFICIALHNNKKN